MAGLVLRLAIVIEVIEHEIEVGVDVLGQVVLDLLFVIDRYFEGFLEGASI